MGLRKLRNGLICLTALLLLSAISHAECIPFDKAPQHAGEIVCVRGRVVSVSASATGTHYLNFCESYLTCPFTVVIFPSRLGEIGDVRSLAEREIEIDGLIKVYDGRPEIVLSDLDQLHGDAAAHLPPLPKKYDVTQHGNFSAGSFYGKRSKRSKSSQVQDESDPFSE